MPHYPIAQLTLSALVHCVCQIWHFRLGKCSIVTDRIYAMIVFTIFLTGACFYVYMRPNYNLHVNPLSHHNEKSVRI